MFGYFSRNAASRPGVMVVSSASATTRVMFLAVGAAVDGGEALAAPEDLAPGVRLSLHPARVAEPPATARPVAARNARLDSGVGMWLMADSWTRRRREGEAES